MGGAVYAAGRSYATDFPTTAGVIGAQLSGPADVFLTNDVLEGLGTLAQPVSLQTAEGLPLEFVCENL